MSEPLADKVLAAFGEYADSANYCAPFDREHLALARRVLHLQAEVERLRAALTTQRLWVSNLVERGWPMDGADSALRAMDAALGDNHE